MGGGARKGSSKVVKPSERLLGGSNRTQGGDRSPVPTTRPLQLERGSGAAARRQGTSDRGLNDRSNSRSSNTQLNNCDTRPRGSQQEKHVDDRPRNSPSLHGNSSRQRDRKADQRVS